MQLHIIHFEQRDDRWRNLQAELRQQEIKEYKIWPGIRVHGAPQTGIARAHKQIVHFAKGLGFPEICIAEDDIQFTAPGAFDFFLENKPATFDLYLGGLSHGRITPSKTVDDFAGLLLYVISSSFYDSFLELDESYHIDRVLKNKGNYKVCDPQPAIEYPGFSDNLQRYTDFSGFYKRRNLYHSSCRPVISLNPGSTMA